MNTELKYLAALSHFPKFGPVRMKKIRRAFSSLEEAFTSSLKGLKAAGVEENVAAEFIAARTAIDPDKLAERLHSENIRVIALEDDAYPKLLKEIYDPPALLYCRGSLAASGEFSLAVVGTRKYSSYGKQAVETIVSELVRNRIVITSGLALGIDTLAHNACLDTGGRTVAVLGTGLNRQSIYPGTNRYLADRIVEQGGAVISEFPLDTQPWRHNFPLRNRIISGLSLGVLVIEAAERSGALITARQALDQNREVFAVPGSIYAATSYGPNHLIKQGAKPVANAADILEALDLAQISSYIDNKKIIPQTGEEKDILVHLSGEPSHINDLVRATGLTTAQVNSTLVIMEMKGMVKNVGNMQYVLAR